MTGKPTGTDLQKGIYTLPVIVELKANSQLREILGSSLSDADASAGVGDNGTGTTTRLVGRTWIGL